MVLNFTFRELGAENLGRDAVWMTPVVVKHQVVENVIGGWSRMLKDFLRHMLLGPHGFSTVGVPITNGGNTVMIWAVLGNLLSDGDGLRVSLDWKGAGGLKPCFVHHNVVSKNSDLQSDRYVDITCADCRRFVAWETDVLEASIDMLTEAHGRVARKTMYHAALERLEKACGFNANPKGLMADVELRRYFHTCEVSTMDWVHTALQNGFVTKDAHLFLAACKPIGLHPRNLEEYLKKDWIFPKGTRDKGKNLHMVFNEFRSHSSAAADKLKASASEMLGLYGLLRHWAATEIGDRPEVRAERESFEAACRVVDIMLTAKRGLLPVKSAAEQVILAHSHYMNLHKLAYGDENIVPKHHWMFDIGEQMRKMDFIFDAFIIERLHLRVKRILDNIKDLSHLESSTLAGICNAQFQEADKICGDGLRGRVCLHDGCRVADACSVGSLSFAAEDAVFRGAELGVVQLFLEDDDYIYAVVRGCEYRSEVSKYGSEWTLIYDDLKLWPVSHLEQA